MTARASKSRRPPCYLPLVLRPGLLALVGSAIVAASAAASSAAWQVVKRASGTSAASINTPTIKGAAHARVTVNATKTMRTGYTVTCTKGDDYDDARGVFNLRNQTHTIPVPIAGGDCTFVVTASAATNAHVTLVLEIAR